MVFRKFSGNAEQANMSKRSNPIDSDAKRQKLKPAKEPYWVKIRTGQYLGFYKGAIGGAWKARATDRDGKPTHCTLGAEGEFTYDEAADKAQAFFLTVARAKSPKYTVREACEAYIADRKVKKSPTAALDAEQRLKKRVIDWRLPDGKIFGDLPIAKLTSEQITAWRNAQVRLSDDPDDVRRSKDGANHLLKMLKAALNHAYRRRLVTTADEWRTVETFPAVAAQRELYLEPEQVAALLTETKGGFHNLVKAAVMTGARYGELIAARVKDFDPKAGTLVLAGKTGKRTAYLADSAVAFFKQISSDRLPGAYLIVRDNGEPWGKSHQHRPMKDAIRAAKLPAESCFYSLRHYYISRALLAGVQAQVVAENCGTSVLMITKHYGKFLAVDRRRMLNEVAL
jgi:integrase